MKQQADIMEMLTQCDLIVRKTDILKDLAPINTPTDTTIYQSVQNYYGIFVYFKWELKGFDD